jgi:hypothetical protein
MGEKQGRRDIKDKPSGILGQCHFGDGTFSGIFLRKFSINFCMI